MDLGGGVRWSDPGLGLSAEVSARGLLAHEAAGLRDRGVSGSLAWRPDGSAGGGPSLTVTQTLGAQAAGGADALLGRETLADLAATTTASRAGGWRSTSATGSRRSATGSRPPRSSGWRSRTIAREYRLGWRLGLARSGPVSFELGLEATRRGAANDSGSGAGAEPEHGVRLELRARF